MIDAHSPTTLSVALTLLAEKGSTIKVIAGGTDLFVLMNARLLEVGEFLDIWKVDELRGISESTDFVRIGSLTTFTQIIRSPITRQHVPSLIDASRTIGAVQVQNRATIGGNIVN